MTGDHIQGRHYDAIGEAYDDHYDDAWSRAYRNRFIYEPLLEGLDLRGATVLEAMCGSGQLTEYLLARGGKVTGLDISERQVAVFRRRWPSCAVMCGSIFSSGLEDGSFDHVVVVGGLHHVQPDVAKAIREIHRILKRGGTLAFAEPHRGSFLDILRRRWYRWDRLFAENEESIDVRELASEFEGQFSFEKTSYAGSLAYLFVLNSMVFRIPVRLKRFYSPALMFVESLLAPFLGRVVTCMVIARWKKIG